MELRCDVVFCGNCAIQLNFDTNGLNNIGSNFNERLFPGNSTTATDVTDVISAVTIDPLSEDMLTVTTGEAMSTIFNIDYGHIYSGSSLNDFLTDTVLCQGCAILLRELYTIWNTFLRKTSPAATLYLLLKRQNSKHNRFHQLHIPDTPLKEDSYYSDPEQEQESKPTITLIPKYSKRLAKMRRRIKLNETDPLALNQDDNIATEGSVKQEVEHSINENEDDEPIEQHTDDDDSRDELFSYMDELSRLRSSSNGVPLDKKRRIVEIVEAHPNWSISTLRHQGCTGLTDKSKIKIWKQQIEEGGTRKEKCNMIHEHVKKLYLANHNSGEKICMENLQKWGLEKANELGANFFTASEQWAERFAKHANLTEEERKWTKSKMCEICGVQVKRESSMVTHLRICHSDKRPFVCTVEGCEKTFKGKEKLARHMKDLHLDLQPEFLCNRCGREFSRKDNFSQHIKRHEDSDKAGKVLRRGKPAKSRGKKLFTTQTSNSQL